MTTSLLTADAELRAKAALEKSPIYDLRDLSVESDGDHLLISGRVASFYHKQLAQELVRGVANGIPVVNETEVA